MYQLQSLALQRRKQGNVVVVVAVSEEWLCWGRERKGQKTGPECAQSSHLLILYTLYFHPNLLPLLLLGGGGGGSS